MITSNINQKIFMLFTDGVNHWYGFGTELEQAKRLERIQNMNPGKEILSFEIQSFSDRFVAQVYAGSLIKSSGLVPEEFTELDQDAQN